jgi:hypothetical protein
MLAFAAQQGCNGSESEVADPKQEKAQPAAEIHAPEGALNSDTCNVISIDIGIADM